MKIGEYLLLIGPNRRSERTLIEQQIVLTAEELGALSSRLSCLLDSLVSSLNTLAVATGEWLSEKCIEPGDVLGSFARLFTGTALALQSSAGHRVKEHGFLLDSAGQGVWAWFEFEHDEVGDWASKLALRLLTDLEPALQWETDEPAVSGEFTGLYQRFLDIARPLLLPLDSEAILAAAQRLDVPFAKLEREPYKGVQGDFRIRMNGLLKLGHCDQQHLVDGSFCVTRNADLLPLLRDREALRQKLLQLQVPLPARDADNGNCVMTRRAIRAADRIGYPVVIKPGDRSHGKGVTLDVRNAVAVSAAVEHARRVSSHVSVEAMVEGVSHKILVANCKVLGSITDGQELPLTNVHESTLSLASQLASQLDCGMLVLDIVTTDPGRPLLETGGAVVDLDLAPELDKLLPAGSPLLDQAAEAFVRWLYPAGSVSRIPIVAVTGTNGKTTTCRMISRIMHTAGRHTAMVCSDGIFVDEQFEATRGDIGPGVHHRVFEYPGVNFAVLEEYFGRIARVGFPFSWCNVAVCTNVTEDHIGRIGTHTLEQMAELKFAVPQRARDAVVLNADDQRCLQMATHVTARTVCLVSCLHSREWLEARWQKPGCFFVIEKADTKDWIVIYDSGLRKPLMALDDIPATFAGTAMHNASNVMHAAAACYLSGAGIDEISTGLASFRMGFDSSPGRLNIYDGLPFKVVMDYAHNADGFRRLCEFIDKQQVTGRRIIMMAIAGDRQDGDIRAAAAEMASHFDHYVCRNYTGTRGRSMEEVPGLMKAGLQGAGVPAEAISIVTDAAEAIRFSLRLAREGDLLVLLPGDNEIHSTWSQITGFDPHSDESSAVNV